MMHGGSQPNQLSGNSFQEETPIWLFFSLLTRYETNRHENTHCYGRHACRTFVTKREEPNHCESDQLIKTNNFASNVRTPHNIFSISQIFRYNILPTRLLAGQGSNLILFFEEQFLSEEPNHNCLVRKQTRWHIFLQTLQIFTYTSKPL